MRKTSLALAVSLVLGSAIAAGQPEDPQDDEMRGDLGEPMMPMLQPAEPANPTPTAPADSPYGPGPMAPPRAAEPVAAPPTADERASAIGGASLPAAGGSQFVPEGRWFDRLEAGEPVFEIRHDPFTLALRGLLQVQVVPLVQEDARRSNGDAADAEGFVLRRARLGIDGELLGGVTYALQYEFFDGSIEGEGGSRLLDAEIGYTRYPIAQLAFGAQKVPFSKVNMLSAANQQLVERPFSARQISPLPPLVPDRQLGASVTGDLIGAARYWVGVFNGNDTLFRGDDNGGFLYAARLELHPLGTTGDTQAAFFPEQEGYGRIRASLGGGVYFDDDATGDQLGWGLDLTVKWRDLSFTTELLVSHFEPDSDPVRPPELAGELDQLAFFAQAGYFILPGRLEIAVRFEHWDTNVDLDDPSDLMALSGGLNLYLLRDRIKAQLQYTHRREPNSDGEQRNDTAVLQLQARL